MGHLTTTSCLTHLFVWVCNWKEPLNGESNFSLNNSWNKCGTFLSVFELSNDLKQEEVRVIYQKNLSHWKTKFLLSCYDCLKLSLRVEDLLIVRKLLEENLH